MALRAVLVVLVLMFARQADAQWFFAGYAGTNTTRPANVEIRIPASDVSLEFQGVEFEAKPFAAPQYYGWRLGKLARGRGIGVEVEFIHMKMYAKTGAAYPISGAAGAITVAPGQRMDAIVERFAMSHGLNFLIVNVVGRREIAGGRAALVSRAGGGITIPHTETTVLNVPIDKYEYAGPGLHAAAGVDVRLSGRLSFVSEYKFTFARPTIEIAGGAGQTSALTHHLAFGVAVSLSR